MKKLIIDPKGGIAGDMFAASLISAGADKTLMLKAMWLAASKLGKVHIDSEITSDQSTRLIIDVDHQHSHLSGNEAKHILNSVFEDLEMDPYYREFGQKALQILIEAEKQAHRENTFLTDHHKHHHEHNHNDHHHDHHHSHDHQHQDAYLHEAQDILIDITGAAYGLQLLESETTAELTTPVSLGGGMIKFSHGEMSAPAPATKIIIQSNWIPAQLGPLDTELCTPTGASILAALNCQKIVDIPEKTSDHYGASRGGKDLPIEPLKIWLFE